MTVPTLAGFVEFVRNIMGINTTVLPDDSLTIPLAYQVAVAIVNPALRGVGIPAAGAAAASTVYALAVYNLAGDNLINYAQDLPGAALVEGSGDPGQPYFAWLRKQWNVFGFVSGVISSSSDDGTSNSMVVQEAAKNFTLSDLQNLKTPYGRTYLSLAQAYGPSTWGLS